MSDLKNKSRCVSRERGVKLVMTLSVDKGCVLISLMYHDDGPELMLSWVKLAFFVGLGGRRVRGVRR